MENKKVQAKELLQKTGAAILYMNPKGEFFTVKNLAENTLKKGEELTVFNASDVKADVEDNKTDEVLEKIQATEDTNVLYGMLDDEKKGENSEEIVEAIEQRIKELENAE